MKISFENPDKINGLLTLVVEEEDYKNDVEKTLKDYRKKANVPGFRPGQAPMGMIKRQFGPSVKMEAINKLVGQQIYKYVQDNNIQMLGEPHPSEKQEPADLENGTSFTFMFDIAVAPEFKETLNGRDKVDYYNITVDDKILDQQIDMYAQRAGSYEKGEKYEENDLLKGDLRELDENGNTKEGGITVEGAILMPSYIKVDEQKNLFNDAKLGDVITVDYLEDAGFVDVVGTSKGKGFQGVIKRHNQSRGPMSHGSQYHRGVGSMGTLLPMRVLPGKKLPGHMGHEQVTIQNLEVISVDLENNVILIKGSVPGPKNSLVLVRTSVKTGDKVNEPVELVVYEEGVTSEEVAEETMETINEELASVETSQETAE